MEGIKILVVEDETIIAMELEDRLKDLGYHVPAIISSGEEAIASVPETNPDLVLMDIMLNGELDGIETAKVIEERYQVPVIYLTANTDPKTIQRAKITGPYGYLVKPFEEETFKITIEMALYKYDMEQRLKRRERLLNTTLKSIAEGVIATDVEGNVKFMNNKAEEITGWEESDAVGISFKSVFDLATTSPDQDLIDNLQTKSTSTWMNEHLFLKPKDGNQIPIEYSEAPILDEGGRSYGSIFVFQDISERAATEERIRYLATHDTLTNLPNLHLFHDRMSHAIAMVKRDKGMLGLLYLDLDGFKQVNDKYGHPFGDKLLKLVGLRMLENVRESDTVARVGGDEFAIILEKTDSKENAAAAASKIIKALSAPIIINDISQAVTASIGISMYPKDGLDEEDLMRNADNAMYIAKNKGKNQFHFHESG